MANNQNSTTPKKVSLQELMQQKLATKKQANGGNNNANHSTATKSLKNQLTKKPNNQKRRTGV